MESDIILNYLDIISRKSTSFFCKNASCKYNPNSINLNIKDKSEFEYEMKKKINNDRPSLPLIIEKIRVLDKSEYDNENR